MEGTVRISVRTVIDDGLAEAPAWELDAQSVEEIGAAVVSGMASDYGELHAPGVRVIVERVA
jgi:hypothetical protein